MNKLSGLIFVVSFVVGSFVFGQDMDGDVFEREVDVVGSNGQSMTMTQILRNNHDGSFTVLRLEPELEVNTFYQAECAGIGSEYHGLKEGELTLIGDAIHGFSCENSQPASDSQ